MSRSIPAGDYVEHFNPELAHHRAWLQAVLERLVAHELDDRPDKTEFEFSKAIKLYNFIIHSAITSASIVAASLPVRAAMLRMPIAMLFLPLCRVRPLKTIMTWRQVPLVTGSATNFFGWLDDSGTPFTSLVIVPDAGGSPAAFATVHDLVLGQAAPASVPGPLPLIGAATAFGFSETMAQWGREAANPLTWLN